MLVGDRGMITQKRIEEDLRGVEGLDWISALRSGQITTLVRKGAIQLELFDERNLAEIQSPDFPGERLVVCRNPSLMKRRRRNEESIREESAIDGVYVVRSSVSDPTMSSEDLVERYKDLSSVENAFRSIKTVDLKIRPIHHRCEYRVRAHVFLCMLAYYVEWHMRQALKPMLLDEDDPETARKQRKDVVAPKKPSPSAKSKAANKVNAQGDPVHSFQTLLLDLSTQCRNTIKPNIRGAKTWTQETEPTPLQTKIFNLLSNYKPL